MRAAVLCALLRRLLFLRRFALLRGFLLRDFRAGCTRFGKTDRDRLLAALDLPARATSFQRARLSLLHRAPDFGGRLLRIFSRHDVSPGGGKEIIAIGKSSRSET